jgi:hypothetical protein
MSLFVFLVPGFSFAVYTEGHDSVTVGSWFSFITKSESDSVNGNFRVVALADMFGVTGTAYIREKGVWAGSYGFDGIMVCPIDTEYWGSALFFIPTSADPLYLCGDSCHCISNDTRVFVGEKEGMFFKLKLTCFKNGFVFFDWGYQDDSTRLFYNTNRIQNHHLQQGSVNKKSSTKTVVYDLRGRIISRDNQGYNNYNLLPSGVYIIRTEKKVTLLLN